MSALPTAPASLPEARVEGKWHPSRTAPLLESAIRQRLTAQAATAATWLVSVGFMLVAAGVAAGGDSRESAIVIRGALGWLTWLGAGGVALAATGATSPDDDAVFGLAALRGIGERELAWARAWAVGRRVLHLLFVPVILVNLAPLPFVRSWQGAAAAASVLWGSLAYVGLLAVTVGALVLAARSLAPAKSRLGLAALVLIPEIVRSLVAHFPSVPSALSGAREFVLRFGGWVA